MWHGQLACAADFSVAATHRDALAVTWTAGITKQVAQPNFFCQIQANHRL